MKIGEVETGTGNKCAYFCIPHQWPLESIYYTWGPDQPGGLPPGISSLKRPGKMDSLKFSGKLVFFPSRSISPLTLIPAFLVQQSLKSQEPEAQIQQMFHWRKRGQGHLSVYHLDPRPVYPTYQESVSLMIIVSSTYFIFGPVPYPHRMSLAPELNNCLLWSLFRASSSGWCSVWWDRRYHGHVP